MGREDKRRRMLESLVKKQKVWAGEELLSEKAKIKALASKIISRLRIIIEAIFLAFFFICGVLFLILALKFIFCLKALCLKSLLRSGFLSAYVYFKLV